MSAEAKCIKCANKSKVTRAKYQVVIDGHQLTLCGTCCPVVKRLQENELSGVATRARPAKAAESSAAPKGAARHLKEVSSAALKAVVQLPAKDVVQPPVKPLDDDDGNVVITSSGKPLSKAAQARDDKARQAIVDFNVGKAIYGRISERIEKCDPSMNLGEEELAMVKNVARKSDTFFNKIMERAFVYAGGKEEIPKIANGIAKAFKDHQDADSDHKQPIFILTTLIPSTVDKKSHACPTIDECSAFMNEAGNKIIVPDVGVVLQNCNQQYIESDGFKSMIDWVANPNHIYIGPKEALRVPYGSTEVLWPEEDSPYYIPIRGGSRIIDNRQRIAEIIRRLESGEEDKEKYLALRGKVLGCVCAPHPCHCDVYVAVLRHLST